MTHVFVCMCQLGGEPLVCLGAVGVLLVGEHMVCQKEVFLCSGVCAKAAALALEGGGSRHERGL